MDGFIGGLGLILFGIGLTWLLTVILGRVVARRGTAIWVWDRAGSIGRILIALGFGLAVLGLAQGTSNPNGSAMVVLGSILGMVGIWMILPGL
jgi:hypothetical protein